MSDLLGLVRLYICLVESHAKQINASKSKFALDEVAVGIYSLNTILPEMCKAAGFKRKTACCLHVTCVSSLFNIEIDEKLIRYIILSPGYFRWLFNSQKELVKLLKKGILFAGSYSKLLRPSKNAS